MSLLRKIRETGRVAEDAPPRPSPGDFPALAGSAQVRCVDAGSCNGCEIEIAAAFGPVYDAERYGAHLVPSPRHADVVLVTGPVTRNMKVPLRRTVAAMAEPNVVVAVGDGALDPVTPAELATVEGAVADVVDVDLTVPGCPPRPERIVAALRTVTGR
jgi:Ni,Fe-hydrogenase III small subunit